MAVNGAGLWNKCYNLLQEVVPLGVQYKKGPWEWPMAVASLYIVEVCPYVNIQRVGFVMARCIYWVQHVSGVVYAMELTWSHRKALWNMWWVVELIMGLIRFTPRKHVRVAMEFEAPKRHILRPTWSIVMVQRVYDGRDKKKVIW